MSARVALYAGRASSLLWLRMRPRFPARPAAVPAIVTVLVALFAAGCGSDADFDSAARTNTTVAWDDYLRAHPDGPHAREARERLAALVEDREWQRAHSADRVDAYQRYLRGYPQGAHAHEALIAIANLNLVATPSSEAPSAPLSPSPEAGAIVRTPPAPAGAGVSTAAPPPAATTPPAPKPAPVPKPTPAPAAHPPATVPAAVRDASAAAPAPAGRYRVQLGAFTEGSDAAERAWRALEARYPELKGRRPLIAPARAADGRAIYRLQVDGLERPAAESLCAELAARHDPCILVPPLVSVPETRR
jgi:hypothetical protein